MPPENSEIDSNEVVRGPFEDNTPENLDDTVVIPAEEVKEDLILTSIREEESPDQILHAVMYGLAEEQDSLKSLRTQKKNEGKDTSHISLKRGTLLKYMSETLIQRQGLVSSNGEVDLRGPKFREVFRMFLDLINDTFDEVKIPPEYKDMFFTALSRNFEGWENKAEKILKGSGNNK